MAIRATTQPANRQMIDDPSAAAEALTSPFLVPPPAPASLGSGAIADLRAKMARFSSGSEHATRRADLDRAIARIDKTELLQSARKRTRLRLHPQPMSICQLGYLVPTEALAIQVIDAPASLHATVAETEQIARAIGRGDPVTPEMDAACDRLLERLADHPDGAVAAASLLYQGFDSTAALLRETLAAAESSTPRKNAVTGTTRFTTAETSIGGCGYGRAELVPVSLDDLALEFGAGPHRCPGEDLAVAIVTGITLALDEPSIGAETAQSELNRTKPR